MGHPWGYDHNCASPYPHLPYKLWGYWRHVYPHVRSASILPRWTSANEYPFYNDDFDWWTDELIRTYLNRIKPLRSVHWLPPRDSNPDMLLQRQLSYH